MSAVLTQHRRWLVGLLAVLLVVGVAKLATHRERGRQATSGGTDGGDVAVGGAPTPIRTEGASRGLLSPFAPVLDVVVTALTGPEEARHVGRCVRRTRDSATRHAPSGRIGTVVTRDGDDARTHPTFDARPAPGPAALGC